MSDCQIADWQSAIPRGWKVDRLGKFAEIIISNVDKKSEDDETPVELCNYVDVYKNDRITRDLDFMEATATQHEIEKFGLKPGDVIVTKDSESPFDISIPSLIVDDLEGVICGYHLAILRSHRRKLFGPFLSWLHVSQTIRAHYEKHATGITRWAVGRKHFKTCPVPIPPLPQQKRIAAYLDASCAAIDRAVETKRKQLDTLDALRKSIVQHAITQGLNPDVEMKDSGVGWLGPIPTHWRVRRIKDIVDARSGCGITSFEIAPEGEFPVYGGNGLRGYTDTYTHEGKFVLIGRQGALCGNINYATGKFYASEHAVVCDPYHKLQTKWFGDLLVAMNLNQYSNAAAQPGLSVARIKRLQIPIPPTIERVEIEKHLSETSQAIAKIRNNCRSQIATLTAYRKSLIHECVTGKRRISEEDVAGT